MTLFTEKQLYRRMGVSGVREKRTDDEAFSNGGILAQEYEILYTVPSYSLYYSAGPEHALH